MMKSYFLTFLLFAGLFLVVSTAPTKNEASQLVEIGANNVFGMKEFGEGSRVSRNAGPGGADKDDDDSDDDSDDDDDDDNHGKPKRSPQSDESDSSSSEEN
ncbi:nucleophosmin-like [Aphidius gifuensis]|uniref:nucleophosmin-like n=1 Tax=Aphidius gifuensis TaxID=684658 RepID=UPI001CDD270D|nr:nucleophosmin-like [Aphidius gifuensis]